MHPGDGELQRYLDNPEQGINSTGLHIQTCATCQRRLASIETRHKYISEQLGTLDSAPGSSSWSNRYFVQPAYSKFKNNLSLHKEMTMSRKFFSLRSRAMWASLTVIVVLVSLLSFPTGRAWAGQFLGLFRVQQITVIPLDSTSLSMLNGNQALGKQIGELMSSSITVDKKPGQPQNVSAGSSASKLAGFTVRLPSNPGSSPLLTVQDGTSFKFVVNRARAQSILDEAGHKDLILPKSLDGETISVNIPNSVSAGYGNCPDPATKDTMGAGSNGRRYADCILLMEIPSPTVNTPPDVDLAKLAEIGLEFTGMSPQQAQQYSQTVDWTTSLVIPIPKNAATYQTVTVDGVNGTLIQRPIDDAPEYTLIWVKNGIIYAIAGLGSDSTQAISMANSLQ